MRSLFIVDAACDRDVRPMCAVRILIDLREDVREEAEGTIGRDCVDHRNCSIPTGDDRLSSEGQREEIKRASLRAFCDDWASAKPEKVRVKA